MFSYISCLNIGKINCKIIVDILRLSLTPSYHRANVENPLKSEKIEFSTREELDNHIQQFEKVFTESYTKSAIITHSIAGQTPKVNKIEGKDNGKLNDTAFTRLSDGKTTFQSLLFLFINIS